MRALLLTLTALLALAAPAPAATPFDALPAPDDQVGATRVDGLRFVPTPAPPDPARRFARPGDRLTVVTRARRLRVQLLRLTRTGRPMRHLGEQTLRGPGRASVVLPQTTGVLHELRMDTPDGRRRQVFLYTAAGGRATTYLDRRAYRPGETVTGELLVAGDTPVAGGRCPFLERAGEGAAVPVGGQACPAILDVLAPGTRVPVRQTLPADLPPGRYRLARDLRDVLTGAPADADVAFDVVP